LIASDINLTDLSNPAASLSHRKPESDDSLLLGVTVQSKKHISANIPILLDPTLRTANDEVKSQATDSDTAKFARKYLDLADKALLTTQEEHSGHSRSSRSARLRLEPQDGSPVKDYRIQDGEVEVRVLRTDIHLAGSEWQRLTPAEIAYHVENNTVVARWLEARLGWRHVLKKCVQAPDESEAA
jgi:hypothetical protein